MVELSLQMVIYLNEFIDIRPWFLHFVRHAIFRRKRAVLTSETSRAVRQSFCLTVTQSSKIQGYKFSCAKIKTQPKVTPLNSLYPVGSSESYFFPPTHFHTPHPHPPPFIELLTLLPGVIWPRRANWGGSGWKLRWREVEKNYIYRRKIKNEGWKESKWQPYWGLLCQRQHWTWNLWRNETEAILVHQQSAKRMGPLFASVSKVTIHKNNRPYV